jgi:drug/metabolite transporter (DMT)-like permease
MAPTHKSLASRLFLYHLCYFLAMRFLPPATALLINALWPLLIVVFAGFLPNQKMRIQHLIAALIGLIALALLVGSLNFGTSPHFKYGIAFALACAFIWSSYSVSARLLPDVPTNAVSAFCLLTGLVSLIFHLLFENTQLKFSSTELLATLILGLGPMGLAFYAWDYAMKHGNVAKIGALSYAAPVSGTLLLVIFGFDKATPTLFVACALIIIASIIASLPKRGDDKDTPP